MDKIAMGAEAEIYREENKILKIRVPKRYRLKQLDDELRKSRTRHEAKILEKMPKEILHPAVLKSDDKKMILEMEFIDGKKVRDVLDSNISLCLDIGRKIALMHNAGIIHGDLTTSNMILKDRKIYFIDFGLSFFSGKVEDKAVDLHLLKQALESKHYKVFEQAFDLVLQGYKEESKDYSSVISKFNQVELRGRNKAKF
jgi:TP53 regulating kinase and related kinases